MKSLSSPRKASGFTLVELLVVIAIIGVLVALLLPAVQAAREAARRTQCLNNLKQIGIGSHLHHDINGFLPSGGWGWNWSPDPDRGFGKEQPGSWVYSLLPFIEKQNVHNLGSDGDPKTVTTAQREGSVQRDTIGIPAFNCPTRRRAEAYPTREGSTYTPYNANLTPVAPRSDYASCFGMANSSHSVPTNPSQMDTYSWKDLDGRHIEGTCFQRSEISFAQIPDGTSNTYLIGEKTASPDDYEGGYDWSDMESMYSGYGGDNCRGTIILPKQDQGGIVSNGETFGSAHPGVWHMLFADASVRGVSYDITKEIHRALGARNDGQVVSTDDF